MSSNGTIIAGKLVSNLDGSQIIQSYEFANGQWNKRGAPITSELNSPNAINGDLIELSSTGDTLVVKGTDDNGRINIQTFVYLNESWQVLASSLESPATAIDLSSDGKVLASSTITNSTGGDINTPDKVKIYNLIDGEWVQRGSDLDGPQNGEAFGRSISLSSSGDILVVGSPAYRGFRQYGKISIYKWNGEDYNLIQNPIYGSDFEGSLGNLVEISGDGHRILAAASTASVPAMDGNPSLGRVGKVYTYNFADNEFQLEDGFIVGTTYNFSTRPILNSSLSLSTDGDSFIMSSTGRRIVQIYTRSADSSWVQLGDDYSPVEGANQSTKQSIAISADGATFAIGNRGFFRQGEFIGIVNVFGDMPVSAVSDLLDNNLIKVIPNPAHSTIYLQGIQSSVFTVFDLYGKMYMHGNIEGEETIDLHMLPAGQYLILLEEISSNEVSYKKFIKL